MAKAISFSSSNAGMMKVIEGSLDCFEFMRSIYFRKEILGLKDAEKARGELAEGESAPPEQTSVLSVTNR